MNTVTFSVFSDAKSPFWLAQLVLPDGKRLKKSTKVPMIRMVLWLVWRSSCRSFKVQT